MALKRGKEIPTIDCALFTVKAAGSTEELALNTNSEIAVEVQVETTEATKLIIKNRLIAQKPEESTITGNKLTLTDNVFNPQLVLILQGGEIDTDAEGNIMSYQPPVAGSSEHGEIFEANAYSAIYNAAGIITGYEKITYPNCQGTPVSLSSKDNAFRAPQYVINSMPDDGQPPYKITYIDELPTVADWVPVPTP